MDSVDIRQLVSVYSQSRLPERIRGLDADIQWRVREVYPFLSDPSRAARKIEPYRRAFESEGISAKGMDVLDIGCGTGYHSLYFLFSGARSVTGVDQHKNRMAAFEELKGCLPRELADKVSIIRGRIEELSFPRAFDMVFCNESLSHIMAPDILHIIYGLLKQKGILFISDGNNSKNPFIKRETLSFWKRMEKGPAGKTGGRVIDETYEDKRKKMILAGFSQSLTDGQAAMLAEKTSGLSGESLFEACEKFIKEGVAPPYEYSYGTVPVEPEFGVYCEKLFDTDDLMEQIRKAGFRKPSLYAVIPGAYHYPIIEKIDRLLPSGLKIYISPSFRIAAYKEQE